MPFRNSVTVPSPAESRIAALVQAYLAADYRWELDGQWFPMPVGARAPELEHAFPRAGNFGLLSAWNPHSVERADEENRAEDELLRAALAATGLPFRAAFSSARNRTWREPSWIVMDMPATELDALARRFGQLATVHAERGRTVRLRVYHAALPNAPGHELVDWVR